MASLKARLTVRYGLFVSPLPEQIERWKQRTEVLIRMGMRAETAADIAAQAILPGYGRSHADASIDLPELAMLAAQESAHPSNPAA